MGLHPLQGEGTCAGCAAGSKVMLLIQSTLKT